MSAGTMIAVRREGSDEAIQVEVLDGADLQARYDRLVTLVMRVGSWLTGPEARLLEAREWEAQFLRYQDRLEELRCLGDQLRPRSLRDREERLTGDALVDEVRELLAA